MRSGFARGAAAAATALVAVVLTSSGAMAAIRPADVLPPGPTSYTVPPWDPAPGGGPGDHGVDAVTAADWNATVAEQRQTVTANEDSPLVFIGDSITARWLTVGATTWDADYAPVGALDLGIGGDTTQDVLWRVDNGELAGLDPTTVVLLIGTNDYHYGWTPQQVAQGIGAVAAAIEQALPTANVQVLDVLPRDEPGNALRSDVIATNEVLRADPPVVVNTAYSDVGVGLIDETTGSLILPDFNNTELHPSAAGYQVLASAINQLPDVELALGFPVNAGLERR